jgi:TPR repeat protein
MARKLIAEVDARRDGRSGTLEFDTMRLLQNNDRIDPLVREDVLALARAQDPLAQTLVANEVRVSDNTMKFSGPVMADLRHAAEAGLPSAESLFGRALLAIGKDEEGVRWLEKAAAHDDGDAQGWLGDIYADATNGQARDIERARHWRERVSLIGTYTQPMEQMGYDYWWNATPTPENRHLAQRWLQNAAARDDEPATEWLAHLYEEGGPGVDGGDAEAVELYRWLVARQPGAADIRWYLANLLGKGPDAGAHKAEIDRLLTEAEQQGDADSQRWLASALAKGKYRPSDPEAAAVWYRRAIAQGHDGARSEYAWMLLDGIGVERDIPAARAQWEAAIAHDQQSARDNMAWALCTHPDSRIHDPREGLRLAEDLDPDNSGYVDTLAACQAAIGNFDQAIETERKAIEMFKRRRPADSAENFESRLAQYRRGERYAMDEPRLRTQIRNAEEARRRQQLR